jgi:hypothetical protein
VKLRLTKAGGDGGDPAGGLVHSHGRCGMLVFHSKFKMELFYRCLCTLIMHINTHFSRSNIGSLSKILKEKVK